MKGYVQDIFSKARLNTYFREVIETGKNTQIVVMSIPSGGEIGAEIHDDTDQVLLLIEGEGKVILDGVENSYKPGDIVLVNQGVKHNFINTGSNDLKIVTMYSPPHHKPGTIHKTKAEADSANY